LIPAIRMILQPNCHGRGSARSPPFKNSTLSAPALRLFSFPRVPASHPSYPGRGLAAAQHAWRKVKHRYRGRRNPRSRTFSLRDLISPRASHFHTRGSLRASRNFSICDAIRYIVIDRIASRLTCVRCSPPNNCRSLPRTRPPARILPYDLLISVDPSRLLLADFQRYLAV